MSAARRLTLTTLVLLCVLAGVATLGYAPAVAEVTHEALSRITEVPATGPHGESVPLPGPFEYTSGLTVDSGDLYVADSSRNTVDKFDASSGAFLQQFGELPSSYGVSGQNLAVGHSTGETEVYDVADNFDPKAEGVVAVYGPAGEIQGYWTGADTPAYEGVKAFKCFQCGSSRGGVAVDNSSNPLTTGDVYVSVPEQKVVDVFEPMAHGGERYLRQLTGPELGVPFQSLSGVAVDQQNGDVLVSDGNAVDVFEPTALEQYVLVRRLTGPPQAPFQEPPTEVVVDSGSGEIFILENEGLDRELGIYQFNWEGAYLGRLPDTSAFNGLAVDPSTGQLYTGEHEIKLNGALVAWIQAFGPNIVIPDVVTDAASSVTHENATLNGTVDPDSAGETTCRFVWGTSTEFGKEAPCEPEDVVEGNSPAPVHATVTGLQPDTTYYFRLEATNRADGKTNRGEPSQNHDFTTSGPGIEEESASNVAATSATLDAGIDPNNATTSYYFQYGTSAAYGTDVPLAPGALVGSAKGALDVVQHLQGLQPSTVYHYRVVVASELAGGEVQVVQGADQTFLTQPVGSGFSLLDGRQWEMVSPSEKHGAEIDAPIEVLQQASIDGTAYVYTTNSPVEASPEGYVLHEHTLALRGREGWVTRGISLPYQDSTGPSIGPGEEYRMFSEDLSSGLVEPLAAYKPSLSPEASEQTPYLRTDYLNGDVEQPCLPETTGCYRPLVTGKVGFADVAPGTVFGEESPGEARDGDRPCEGEVLMCGPRFVGATPDLSRVLVGSAVPLLPGGGNLYEWEEGKLTNVAQAAGGGDGASDVEISPRHGISSDGSPRVFYVDGEGLTRHLYMRDLARSETVQLDVVQGGTGEGQAYPQVQAASSDGSRVFFTDAQRLTADAGEGENLYLCEVIKEAGGMHCKLSDLSPASGESGESGVQGVLGASEDGSSVYFVADAPLVAGAVSGSCGLGLIVGNELCNLYVAHDGTTKLVAVLTNSDNSDWSVPPRQSARVSPSGQWLAFMSQRDLTDYSTSDALDDRPDAEVYLYDASTGALVCASCDPTGARPIGVEHQREGEAANVGQPRIVDLFGAWRQFAANLPEWTDYGSEKTDYQQRYLSDSGRLFFNSDDALVSQDVNGTEDVYEYEPPGVGSCTESSKTYSGRTQGCVDMISSGTSGDESAFLDAGGSGGDVFFMTAAKLVPQDFDDAQDVYDAHECTAAVPCYPPAVAVPPPCDTGDSCKPSPTPQPAIFGTPSSATFSGAGNIVPSTSSSAGTEKPKAKMVTRSHELADALKRCKARRRGRSRASCERHARARYAKRTSGEARNTRKKGGRG